MKAWAVVRPRAPLECVEIADPVPTGTEVVVEVTAAGVCHSDLHFWEGEYNLGGGRILRIADRGAALPRAMGHREGVQALKRTVQAAPDFGIECLTVFGFSTENWRRPVEEVSDLMGLVRSYVSSDLNRLAREGVRVRVLGRRTGLPSDIDAIVAYINNLPARN